MNVPDPASAPDDPRKAPDGYRPAVRTRGNLVPIPLVVVAGALLAISLFASLEARRAARSASADRAAVRYPPMAPPPELVLPPPVPMPSPATVTVLGDSATMPAAAQLPGRQQMPQDQPQLAQPQLAQPQLALPEKGSVRSVSSLAGEPVMDGGRGPALAIDLTTGNGIAGSPAANASEAAGADDTAHATLIHNRSWVVPQGTLLAASLETPLNSDHPGLARAIVSSDARGFDGSLVLIPRGSRLIGEFKADSSASLRRVLVTWTRLIRPDGVAIRLGSPATDSLGGAGIPGKVNTHFAEKFASAVLQSVLTVGVNVASQWPGGNNAVFVGVPGSLGQTGQQLLPQSNRAPTVKVQGGAQIAILVAHDLDFSGTPAAR